MNHQTLFSRRSATKKYSPRPVITTRDRAAHEQWQQATAAEAPLGPRQFAAGVVQHPHTGLYQTWLSTNGLDVASISAHRSIIRAEASAQMIKELITSGDCYDEEKAASLFVRLKQDSDEEPQSLPDNLVRQIGRAILRRIVDGPNA